MNTRLKKVVLCMAAWSLLAILSFCVYRYCSPVQVAFTFDDGTLDEYQYAAPILEKYGYRGFFNIISGKVKHGENFQDPLGPMMSWEQISDLEKRGHEISSHTHSHRTHIGLMSCEEIERELLVTIDDFRTNMNFHVRYVAFPQNAKTVYTDEIVLKHGLIPVRANRIDFPPYLRNYTIDEVFGRCRRNLNGTCVLQFHGICKGGGWNSFDSPDEFEDIVRQVKKLEEQGVIKVSNYSELSRTHDAILSHPISILLRKAVFHLENLARQAIHILRGL